MNSTRAWAAPARALCILLLWDHCEFHPLNYEFTLGLIQMGCLEQARAPGRRQLPGPGPPTQQASKHSSQHRGQAPTKERHEGIHGPAQAGEAAGGCRGGVEEGEGAGIRQGEGVEAADGQGPVAVAEVGPGDEGGTHKHKKEHCVQGSIG